MTPFLFVDYATVEAAPESGRVYAVLANHLGCPEAIQDAEGRWVWTAQIEPYGHAVVDVGADFHQPLRWPGHYFDAELGLHHNRFRMYSPELGRYLEPDPLGRAGGLENVYQYTTNPLKTVDVRGLSTSCPVPSKKRPVREPEEKPDEEDAEAPAGPEEVGGPCDARAKELASLMGERTQKGVTISVVQTVGPNGEPGPTFVGSSESDRGLRPAVLDALGPGEVPVPGDFVAPNPSEADNMHHAEPKGAAYARDQGYTPVAYGASRDVCGSCQENMARDNPQAKSQTDFKDD
jgi:RHS repeat-associated protein